jgi:hypothetical protein
MQAQTITTRRSIRIPWMPLLLAALLVGALVLGTAVMTNRGGVTNAPATGQTLRPKDLAGPTAYPGFVPNQKIPHHGSWNVSDTTGGQTAPVFVAPNGKPLP